MVRLRLILASSLLISFSAGYAQLPTQSLQGKSVNSVCAEGRSKLLMATDEGLWKFDGKKFDQVPIRVSGKSFPAENLVDVLIDNDEVIWAASRQNGLFVKLGSDWVHINSNNGAPQAPINDLSVDSFGRIWIGTEGEGTIIFVKGDSSWHRIMKTRYEVFKGGSWVLEAELDFLKIGPKSNNIRVVEVGTNGAIWLGTDGGLARFSSGSGIIDRAALTKNVHWQYFLAIEQILSLAFDLDGNTWAGTFDYGVYRLGANGSVENFRMENSLLNDDRVSAIELDMDGILWFGTDAGVCRFNPKAKSSINQWRFLDEEQNPSFKEVKTIFNDSDNNLWFGLLNDQGILRLNNNWFTFRKESLGASTFVAALLLNKEEIWVGTTKGIVRLRGEDPVQTIIRPGSTNRITSLAPAKNSQVWAGVFGDGVFLYDANGMERRSLNSKGVSDTLLKKVTQIIERNDEVWIATLAGLSRFSLLDSSWTNYTQKEEGLVSNSILCIAFDHSGKLWCGTEKGVSRLNPNSGTWEPPLTTNNGLSNNVVTAIASHPKPGKNEMWLGTDGGGISIFNDAGRPDLTQPKVLADNVINQIVFSQNGDEVWIATPGGVSHRDTSGVWGTFSTQSGLASDFVQCLALQGDSLRWFGTWGSGLTRYRPPQSFPETFIDSRLDVTDKSEVTYHFSAADLNTAQGEFRFQYWIDTQKPSEPTADRFAVVAIPEPVIGPHTFYVRAIDRDGNYDQKPARDGFYRIDSNFGGWTSQKLDSSMVRLYIPPTVLREQGVAITPVDLEELNDPLAILAFEVSLLPQSATFKFRKPATLQVMLKNRQEVVKKELAIFRKDTLASWIGIGGTVANSSDSAISITTAITELGRYAVRKRRGINDQPPSHEVNIQPRIFSPAAGGQGYGDRTSISFLLKNESMVTIKVYNLSGRLVRAFCENRSMNPGRNVIEWNGRDYNNTICPSGLYIVTIEAAGNMATKQVVVMNE